MLNQKQKLTKLLNSMKILLLPLGVYILMELISRIFFLSGLFETTLDVYNFFRSVGVTILSAYALSINMSTGRMDLSLGGQRMLGCMVGGNLAISFGLGPVGVLLFCTVFGVASGLIVGVLFVTLRLPSFVLGIGMALVYESIAVIFAPTGFQLFGNAKLFVLSNTWLILGIAGVAVVVMTLLMEHTKFGLQYNAIRGSQRVSINSGINVNKSAILCYAICGGLISLSGVLETGYNGYMIVTLNLTSTATAFGGFVPVFLAMMLQRWCPLSLGIPVSVITFRFLSMGLTKMNLPQAASTTITMLILLTMLVAVGIINEKGIERRLELRKLEQ